MSAPPSVLLVEDDEDIRNLLVTRLHRLGYEVRAVATGEEAVDAALAAPPSLVLLDGPLPGFDGRDVTRRLRAAQGTAAVPVLVVAIVDDGPDEEPGVVAPLTRPFGVRDVESMVRALIEPLAEGA